MSTSSLCLDLVILDISRCISKATETGMLIFILINFKAVMTKNWLNLYTIFSCQAQYDNNICVKFVYHREPNYTCMLNPRFDFGDVK